MTFTDDTAVTRTGPGRYTGALPEHWQSLVGIHGGYTAALVVHAIADAIEDPTRSLRSFATQFAAIPRHGPVDVEAAAAG